MKKRLLRRLLLSICLLVGTCAAYARDGEVTLYSLNHLQSRLLPVKASAKQSLPAMGGLSAAAGIVKADMRKSVNPIFAATGEAVAGTMWRYFKGRPEMTALERAGVAVNSLGKHEFDYGLGHLKEALSATRIPIVISNLVTRDPELPGTLQKNVVLQAGDMKVGFFGLLSPAIMRLTNQPEGVSFDPDFSAVAREMVDDLRRKGADVIVLLSGLYENESVALARSVAGIHVITGCGSPVKEADKPILIQDPEGGKTVLIWSGVWGQFVGRLGIRIKDGRLDARRTSWKLLPIRDRAAPDPGVLEVALEYEDKLARTLSRVIGNFARPIDAREKTLRTGEAPIGNFITDSMRFKAGTDVALINSGGIRGDIIYPAGKFSERTLADILPFGDRIFVLTLTGKELRRVLEISASALIAGEADAYDPTKRLHKGSFLQVSGLKAVYDLSEPPTVMKDDRVLTLGSRLKSLLVLKDGGWKEVADDGTYTVATTGWMANGDDAEKYGILRSASRTETPYLDTDAFAEYLAVECRGKADPRKEGRIIVTGRGGERPL
nr:5'-nucleotidase C-terminal domain-containing protein [uncultured Fretibacterium sp.]